MENPERSLWVPPLYSTLLRISYGLSFLCPVVTIVAAAGAVGTAK